ncbi:hypothetical protein HKL94_00865 [Candidatus Parcubacteria bacterium]|nr:hypothetical protein [Candidatus Parcubacteria bacterium]
MLIKLESEALNSKRYLRYLFETIVSRQPLTRGKLIEIHVRDGETPLPEFTETPDDPAQGPHMRPQTAREAMCWRYIPPRKGDDIGNQILDADRRRETKEELIFDYTREVLGGLCRVHGAAMSENDSLDISFKLTVQDPEALHRAAQAVGVSVARQQGAVTEGNGAVATFTENPAQIEWSGISVSIPPNSKQFCVCRVMFNRASGEIVSWDDIADEIDGGKGVTNKTTWRSVYDAVREINKRVEAACGEKLFETTRQSFRRKA